MNNKPLTGQEIESAFNGASLNAYQQTKIITNAGGEALLQKLSDSSTNKSNGERWSTGLLKSSTPRTPKDPVGYEGNVNSPEFKELVHYMANHPPHNQALVDAMNDKSINNPAAGKFDLTNGYACYDVKAHKEALKQELPKPEANELLAHQVATKKNHLVGGPNGLMIDMALVKIHSLVTSSSERESFDIISGQRAAKEAVEKDLIRQKTENEATLVKKNKIADDIYNKINPSLRCSEPLNVGHSPTTLDTVEAPMSTPEGSIRALLNKGNTTPGTKPNGPAGRQ